MENETNKRKYEYDISLNITRDSINFQDKLKNYIRNQYNKYSNSCKNESETEKGLFEPFLTVLGYNLHNINEVVSEYTADAGSKQYEKVDYALCINEKIRILIECKSATINLNNTHVNQLCRYFNSEDDVVLGILTNGKTYQFYDRGKHTMNTTPFLELDLGYLSCHDVSFLELIQKDTFDIENIPKFIIKQEIYTKLSKELDNPSDEFINLIFNNIDVDIETHEKRSILKEVIGNYIVNQRKYGYVLDGDRRGSVNLDKPSIKNYEEYNSINVICDVPNPKGKKLNRKAYGKYVNENKFIILKGSYIREDYVENYPKRCKKSYYIRNKLIEEGAIDENFCFTKDFDGFKSPSAASTLIKGRDASGLSLWYNYVNGEKISLKELLQR